jgi:hypothetical protein
VSSSSFTLLFPPSLILDPKTGNPRAGGGLHKPIPGLIFAPGGAAEALLDAKKQGKVRFVGFTGHKGS